MPYSEESQVQEPKRLDEQAENSPLIASEEEALAIARASPSKALPIRLTFSSDDTDNPRNFGKLRKYYVTFIVSFLNVVTYVSLFLLPLHFLVHRRTFYLTSSFLYVGHGLAVVSHPVPRGSRLNLEFRKRSRRFVCPCTYLAMLLVLCFLRLSRNIMDVNQCTSFHGSSYSCSNFRLPWLPTSAQ